jgi:hypothetical protein
MTPGKRLIDPLVSKEEAELGTPDEDVRATPRSLSRIDRPGRPPIRVGPGRGASREGTLHRPAIVSPWHPRLGSASEATTAPKTEPFAHLAPDDRIPRGRGRARVSIVIPTLNEALNLPHVLPNIPSDVHEVILVDGHSVDDTIAVARALFPPIRVVMESQRGKGAALCAGFRAAEGDIIVTLDADGSTDPTEIPLFVDALLQGAEFAKGSRFLPNGGSTDISRLRAFGNRGFVSLVRLLYGGQYTDLCYGYNAFWASVLPTLALDGAGFEIETMMNVRALRQGLRITEVPSFERSRIHGASNLRTFRDGWRVLRTIVTERLSRRRSIIGLDVPPSASGSSHAAVNETSRPLLVPVMDSLPRAVAELVFELDGGPISDVDADVAYAVRLET